MNNHPHLVADSVWRISETEVRKRPGMYGSACLGGYGLGHLAHACFGNP